MKIKFEYAKLRTAILKNPTVVRDETAKFFIRSQASLRSKIANSPWRLGSNGGGSPVKTGNLQKAHVYRITATELSITVNQNKAPYAKYVHGIDGFPRKRSYQLRPWLRYAEKSSMPDINSFARQLLNNITEALGK